MGHQFGQLLGIARDWRLGPRQRGQKIEEPGRIVCLDRSVGSGVRSIGAERLLRDNSGRSELLVQAKEVEIDEVRRRPVEQFFEPFVLALVMRQSPTLRVGRFGGPVVRFGADEAPLKALSASYRGAFARAVG